MDLAQGTSKRKLKTMHLSQFFAIEEGDTETLQKEKNNGTVQKKVEKVESSRALLMGSGKSIKK